MRAAILLTSRIGGSGSTRAPVGNRDGLYQGHATAPTSDGRARAMRSRSERRAALLLRAGDLMSIFLCLAPGGKMNTRSDIRPAPVVRGEVFLSAQPEPRERSLKTI